MSDKTEQPSARRLNKARSEGDSPVSAAFSQSVGFAAALAVVAGVVAVGSEQASTLLAAALKNPGVAASPTELAKVVLTITLPVLAVAGAANAAASLVQTGGVISAKKLSPSLDKLNPFTGIKNLFSWQRIVGIARALLAASLVSYFAVRKLEQHAPDFAAAVGNARAASFLALVVASKVAWFAAAIGLALGLLDLLLTRRAWLKRHRMSKDELKREHRESEGDPALKAARKRAHQEALTGATLGALKSASVPIVRDVPVARALNELEIGDEIPEALYEAVAEILREIWRGETGTPEADSANP